MTLRYFQLPRIIMYGVEAQTLMSLILQLNYSEVFCHLYSWCITVYQTIHFYQLKIDNVLLHCAQMSGLSMIDGVYICLWTRALSVCGCESSVLYVTYTCKRGTPHGIYLTHIATVHAKYIQCYGVILAPVTLIPDKCDHIHLQCDDDFRVISFPRQTPSL